MMFPYQQRVVDEKKSMDLKIESLQTFIHHSLEFAELGLGEQSRMRIQLEIMGVYSCILGERIAHFNRGANS